jgi:formate hydrogenlyase subunit 3/multisubunit Na+/H+ antiporter MnhD subunit
MTIQLLLAAVAAIAASGLAALAFTQRPRLGQRLATTLFCAGAVAGLAAAVLALAAPEPPALALPWQVPGGAFTLRLDPLSALFLLPVFLVPALGSIYGLGYYPQASLGARSVRLQVFYGLVTGAMALVVTAANAVLFLVAWEVMALAGFFLIQTDHEKREVRAAAFVYLAATHLGTLALIALFSILGSAAGSLEFARMQGLPATTPWAGWAFALLLLGFGLKAGIMPLHFWLPGAHASGPSHVSALMSGVLIKMGVYGILRTSGFFDAPPASWGFVLLALGAVSGVLGVAFALAQHDLKRILAYCSVENVGIITMGVGLALLGRARGEPVLAALGLAGALLHVLNHAVFKSLLFFGAGSIQHATGTRELDQLGGLGKAMRATSLLFLVGAAAISGLPPLNGFASEWMVSLASLQVLRLPAGDPMILAVLTAPALGLLGGLAAACFVKVHGIAFLGSPRSERVSHAHESPRTMLVPMAVLAAICAAVGLGSPLLLPALARAAQSWTHLPVDALAAPDGMAARSTLRISLVAAGLLVLMALLVLWRRWAGKPSRRSETWSCGYSAPTARMQYTGSSLSTSLVELFSFAVFPRLERLRPRGPFPRRAVLRTTVPDTILDLIILPAISRLTGVAARLRALYRGRVRVQVLLVLATLVVLLALRFLIR